METKKQDLKRILIYVIITFALTWVYCLLVVYPIARGETLSGIPAAKAALIEKNAKALELGYTYEA